MIFGKRFSAISIKMTENIYLRLLKYLKYVNHYLIDKITEALIRFYIMMSTYSLMLQLMKKCLQIYMIYFGIGYIFSCD